MPQSAAVELNCRETQILLRHIPPDLDHDKWTREQVTAAEHYSKCSECRTTTLSQIVERTLTCQEALLQLAVIPGALFLKAGRNINQQLAREHVWGHSEPQSLNSGCSASSCSALRRFWQSVPLSCSYDGEDAVAREIPLYLRIFRAAGWPLGELLKVQQERLEKLALALDKASLSQDALPSEFGYRGPVDATTELMDNLKALQWHILELTEPNQPRPKGG